MISKGRLLTFDRRYISHTPLYIINNLINFLVNVSVFSAGVDSWVPMSCDCLLPSQFDPV